MRQGSIWVLASRPKTLTAAFSPILLGTALAFAEKGAVSWTLSLWALLAAIAIQIGTNFVNDALDFKKGADSLSRIGPVRVTQSGLLTVSQVLTGGTVCFTLAILFGIPLFIKGGLPIILILAISIICGYLYTGGAYPLAYHGLGDIFVFIFFGIVSTVSVYYLQTGSITVSPFVAGSQVGLLSVVILAVNNLRDVNEDAKANKKTLPVRFGKTFGRLEITASVVLPFILNLYWGNASILFTLLLIPLGMKIIFKVWNTSPSREFNNILGLSSLLQLSFGFLLSMVFLFG